MTPFSGAAQRRRVAAEPGRVLGSSLGEGGVTQVRPRVPGARLERHRGFERLSRLGALPERPKDRAERVARLGRQRPVVDGAVRRRQGAIRKPPIPPSARQGIVQRRVARASAHPLGEIVERRVGHSGLQVGGRHVEVLLRRRRTGERPQRLLQRWRRSFERAQVARGPRRDGAH